MPKKFTNKAKSGNNLKKKGTRLCKKPTFWHRITYPSVRSLTVFMFFAVLFLFPAALFSRLFFRISALILSLYVLLALLLRLPHLFRSLRRRLKARSHRYTRGEFWARITLYGGLLFNLGYAVFRTVMGVMTSSLWFLTESVYYMGLCTARFWVTQADTPETPDPSNYRRGGILLLVLWLSAVATVTLAVRERRFAAYPILAVVAAALFALWRLGAAFFSVFRFHRKREMVPLLAKAVSLSSATVSLFGLQATLLSRWSVAKALRTRLNTAGGVFVCISLPVMALFIINKGHEQKKDL